MAGVLSLVSTGLVVPAQQSSRPVLESRVQAVADRTVRPGFSRRIDTGLKTQLVGFQWEGRSQGALEVRTLDGDEAGPWIEVHGEPSEGPDVGSPEYRGRTSAGPVWLGPDVKEVEVRVTEGELPVLEMHAIRSETPNTAVGARPARAAVAAPTIVTRAAWGADESFRTLAPGCDGRPLYASRVRYAVVHHTATDNAYTPAQSAAVVRAIYYFHTHSNGYCDIGYNFLVDRFGTVYEGRAGGTTEAVVGAHASGFNNESTGVAVIGTFTTDDIPQPAYLSLRNVLAWKLARSGVDPQSRLTAGGKTFFAITGHKALNATECPGAQLDAVLGQLRADVQRQMAADPGWVQQPGTWASESAMATIPTGWEMFHIGSDSRIYRRTLQAGFGEWRVIDGPRAKKIATTTSADGRVELFYVGMDDQVYHHWETSPGGDISSSEALGGWAIDIAAARGGSYWEVFVVGADRSIERATLGNRSWQRMAGTWAQAVAAATSRDGRVELFHIGSGGNVYHAWQPSPGAGFGGWLDRSGQATDIGASSVGNGEWELYAAGTAGAIWRLAPWSTGNTWQQLLGRATQVSAARHPDGRVEVVHVGGSNGLYHAWQKRVGFF